MHSPSLSIDSYVENDCKPDFRSLHFLYLLQEVIHHYLPHNDVNNWPIGTDDSFHVSTHLEVNTPCCHLMTDEWLPTAIEIGGLTSLFVCYFRIQAWFISVCKWVELVVEMCEGYRPNTSKWSCYSFLMGCVVAVTVKEYSVKDVASMMCLISRGADYFHLGDSLCCCCCG